MHTVFALLCFVVVIHWLIFPYPSGLLHWHCGNLTIAPVPAKQPWWIWINTSFEFIMNDYITTTKQSTTKPCAYFLGYTVVPACFLHHFMCSSDYECISSATTINGDFNCNFRGGHPLITWEALWILIWLIDFYHAKPKNILGDSVISAGFMDAVSWEPLLLTYIK